MLLNEMKFMSGSMKCRKRCRGQNGKVAGRGLKGQKARSGVSLSNFQGGQTSLERRVPKTNRILKKKGMMGISLKKIQSLIDSSLLSKDTLISKDILLKFKILRLKMKYKLIGNVNSKISIEANAVSCGAKKSIESKGGEVSIIGV